MEPLTLNPTAGPSGVTDPQQSLLSILQQMQQVQSAPLAPSPLGAAGAALAGFGAGYMGKPNPVAEMFTQARQQQTQQLIAQAGIASTLSNIKEKEEDRKARFQTLQANVAGGLLKLDDPTAVAMGLRQYKKMGLLNLDDNAITAISQSGAGKTLVDRLKLGVGAIEAGVNPSEIGVNLTPDQVGALQKMTPEQRTALFGPDAKAKFLDNEDKQLTINAARLKAAATQRVQMGSAAPEDYKIAGLSVKGPDEVVGAVLAKFYNNKPLNDNERLLVKDYLRRQQLSGITSNAQIAMLAATGDPDAKRALASLKIGERNVTAAELYLRAGEVKARVQADPSYKPSIAEQAVVNAADMMAEQKNMKPLPQYMEKRFGSMRTIATQLSIIDDLVATKGAEKFLGPIVGRTGKWAEAAGLHDPVRAQLQTALGIVFAEVGPEKFGGQFTGPEQKIISDFMAAATNPGGQFKTRLKAVMNMVQRKYTDAVTVSKAGHFLLPKEFEEYPGTPTPPPDTAAVKARIKELLLQGKTPAEIETLIGGQK